MNDILTCRRCGDHLIDGDEYFDTGDGILCPDCFDAWAASIKRTVGDVQDLC